jgi:hypothetical protein
LVAQKTSANKVSICFLAAKHRENIKQRSCDGCKADGFRDGHLSNKREQSEHLFLS